jgi:heterotetrameric sarcosine oxidase delta subunit
MLRIACPVCGLRDETEFAYGGDATLVRPAHDETDREVWFDYVFLRNNPRGPHREYWQHVHGCRQWLVVARDTLTHDIGAVRLARDQAAEARR